MKSKKLRASDGFSNLMNSYTDALERNSNSIANMLDLLADKKLSIKEKKELKSIVKELDKIDSSLKNLGEDDYGV